MAKANKIHRPAPKKKTIITHPPSVQSSSLLSITTAVKNWLDCDVTTGCMIVSVGNLVVKCVSYTDDSEADSEEEGEEKEEEEAVPVAVPVADLVRYNGEPDTMLKTANNAHFILAQMIRDNEEAASGKRVGAKVVYAEKEGYINECMKGMMAERRMVQLSKLANPTHTFRGAEID